MLVYTYIRADFIKRKYTRPFYSLAVSKSWRVWCFAWYCVWEPAAFVTSLKKGGSVCTCIYIYAFTSACAHTYMTTSASVCKFIYLYVPACIRDEIRLCISVYLCVYVLKYMNTYWYLWLDAVTHICNKLINKFIWIRNLLMSIFRYIREIFMHAYLTYNYTYNDTWFIYIHTYEYT